MNREFLELYNRELRVLKENAQEFAEEFPGVAERLGGLLEGNTDPMIAGLLEGTAFLASRVQLKLRHEYEQFTNNLLEQLVPDYLAPTPSAALLAIEPPYAEPNLKDGMKIAGGSYVEARFVEKERRMACKFRLSGDTTLWPFEIANAEFLPTAAALQGLGVEREAAQSGLRISLLRRSVARREDEPNAKQVVNKPESWISTCRTDELSFRIVCSEVDAVRIYEKIFANRVSIDLRHLNEHGDPVVTPLPPECIQPIGFEESQWLFPRDQRIFSGFELLREYFTLPVKFLGFKLAGLAEPIKQLHSNRADVILTFDRADSRLLPVVKPDTFALFTVPAANVFEMNTARVPVKANEHEYHVVSDRSRQLDFEVLKITKAFAHFAGNSEKREVFPLFAGPPLDVSESATIFYTLRRLPRRRSQEERRFGQVSSYVGTETFLTLTNHANREDGLRTAEISLRALCSNRHLAEHLPVGQGGADFILEDNTDLKVSCIGKPTPPRDPVVFNHDDQGASGQQSTAAWRLINILSLNHFGILKDGTTDSAAALREVLSLFANLSDSATERRIRGIKTVESRPINRRVRQRNGTGVVRGLEIRVTCDERAFEGTGLFLLGAILDRFFSEYVTLNTVVQTVLVSSERGVIGRWPVRFGRKSEL
jgi:type VI secretion system protein ImpG